MTNFDEEPDHTPTRHDYQLIAISRLETLENNILAEIDGGEELRGRDSQLSAWAADIENAVNLLKQAIQTTERIKNYAYPNRYYTKRD